MSIEFTVKNNSTRCFEQKTGIKSIFGGLQVIIAIQKTNSTKSELEFRFSNLMLHPASFALENKSLLRVLKGELDDTI